jgi:hypothetical protein
MITVAEAVRTTDTAEPARVAVKLAKLPPGWALESAGTLGNTYGLIEDLSRIQLVKGSHSYRDVDQVRTPPRLPSVVISVAPYQAGDSDLEIAPGEVTCPRVDWCVSLSADRTWMAGITATAADLSTNNPDSGITQKELKTMLRSATIADPGNRSTWFPVTAGK